MSEQLGKLITCNRCGETKFLKRTGEEGLSSYACPGTRSTYEELPRTWIYDTKFGHLCPHCAEIFVRWLKDFFGQEQYEKVAYRWKIEEDK